MLTASHAGARGETDIITVFGTVVPGSSPGGWCKDGNSTNSNGVLAQLARASALHAEGHRFDSDRLHRRGLIVTQMDMCGTIWRALIQCIREAVWHTRKITNIKK